MRKFSTYIVGGMVAILIVMSLLDLVYTKIYETAPPRSKFQYLRSLKNTHVDFIFIGSSRVENGIVPSVIFDKTHKKALNLGFQAAKLGDIYTLLQLVEEYNIQFETIFIQVDYIYNLIEGHSNIFEYQMTPFIRENAITKAYSDRYAKNPFANYYIPFYRYCDNDLKLGFREIFANLIHKKSTILIDNGYGPKFGNEKEIRGAFPDRILDANTVIDSIQSFAKKNNRNVVFYCAPFCKNPQNLDFTSKLKTKIPDLKDFSGVLEDDLLFLNCTHVNDAGARKFTAIFAEKMLLETN